MAKQPDSDGKLPDPAVWAENWTRIAERSQKLLSEFASNQQNETTPANPDPLNLTGAFMAMTANLMADPERLVEAQRSEEHTSELQSLMRHSYAVFCLKKNTQ